MFCLVMRHPKIKPAEMDRGKETARFDIADRHSSSRVN